MSHAGYASKFMESKLCSTSQYGSRKKKSTVIQLLETYNEVGRFINERVAVDTILFDFKRVRMVDASLIEESLQSFVVGGKVQNWIASYVSQR